MPDYVCALVGEILGERKNIPVFKRIKKVWAERREIIPEQKVLTDFMECYRNVRRNTNETQGIKESDFYSEKKSYPK